jgi:hypothetical protein
VSSKLNELTVAIELNPITTSLVEGLSTDGIRKNSEKLSNDG